MDMRKAKAAVKKPIIERALADKVTYAIPDYFYHAYKSQYYSATRREIEFNFTLLGYYVWWKTELAKIGPHAKRGLRKGEYAMCRYGDTGPYAPDNVYAGLATDNAHDRMTTGCTARAAAKIREWHANNDCWLKGRIGAQHPKSRAVIAGGIVYESVTEASNAHGLTRQGGLARVMAGTWTYVDERPGDDRKRQKFVQNIVQSRIKTRERRQAQPAVTHHKSKPVLTPKGAYESVTMAAKDHNISRQAGHARIKRGVWNYVD